MNGRRDRDVTTLTDEPNPVAMEVRSPVLPNELVANGSPL